MAKKRTKPNRHPSKIAPSPSWTLEKGISFSLLSKFVNCRERFRLHTVEGMRTEGGSLEAMNWGTYFHELIEIHANNPNLPATGIIRRAKKVASKEGTATANAIFKRYLERYDDSNYTYVFSEQEFRIPYVLPSGKKVFLVGKTDEGIARPDGTIWIQENKTKEKFQEALIEATLTNDLQTMMYAVCMEALTGKRVSGIVYNVIRKPSIKPKMLTKAQCKLKGIEKPRVESTTEFIKRLDEDIEERPQHYFKRWETPLEAERLQEWKVRTFNPMLSQLCMWWDSVKHDPFSPWVLKNGEPNPHHWQKPFGIYDPMSLSTGDFFDYLLRGLSVGVSVGNEPFPELETIN